MVRSTINARSYREADVPLGQIIDKIDEVTEITVEPIKFPHDNGVTTAQRLQASRETRTVLFLARCSILVNVAGPDTSLSQRVALKVMHLAIVGFRHPRISN